MTALSGTRHDSFGARLVSLSLSLSPPSSFLRYFILSSTIDVGARAGVSSSERPWAHTQSSTSRLKPWTTTHRRHPVDTRIRARTGARGMITLVLIWGGG